jgi:glycine cleavage system pyridoxal-binding protein P
MTQKYQSDMTQYYLSASNGKIKQYSSMATPKIMEHFAAKTSVESKVAKAIQAKKVELKLLKFDEMRMRCCFDDDIAFQPIVNEKKKKDSSFLKGLGIKKMGDLIASKIPTGRRLVELWNGGKGVTEAPKIKSVLQKMSQDSTKEGILKG